MIDYGDKGPVRIGGQSDRGHYDNEPGYTPYTFRENVIGVINMVVVVAFVAGALWLASWIESRRLVSAVPPPAVYAPATMPVEAHDGQFP